MSKETDIIIEKAFNFLEAAKWNLQGKQYDTVINRAYYSMFTGVQAMLYVKGITTKTHKGTHNQFHKLFILTSVFDKNYGIKFNDLFEMRQTTDYDFEAIATKDDAVIAIQYAEEFLAKTKQWLQENAPN